MSARLLEKMPVYAQSQDIDDGRDDVAVPMQTIQATRMSFIQDSKGSLPDTAPASPQEGEWSEVPTKQEEVVIGLKGRVDSLQGALRRSDARNADLQGERATLTPGQQGTPEEHLRPEHPMCNPVQ